MTKSNTFAKGALAAAAGVETTRRAETIPVEGFVAMANELAAQRRAAKAAT